MRKKRVILSAGGTGGHLFPAQVVAKDLQPHCDILFLGGRLSQNKFFDRTLFPFHEVNALPLSINPKNLWKLGLGIKESLHYIKKFSPDLVIGFGSYFTFPVLVSALIARVPIMLHEQNALPGRVNRLFAPFAKVTAVTFPQTLSLLRSKRIVEVAFPQKLRRADDPWAYFGFQKEKNTILVFGGSQGAKALNEIFMESTKLLSSSFQILHFTGDQALAREAATLYKSLGHSCVVKAFEERIENAWAIADVAITRAGAATISELLSWEVPAILIPFPQAKDDHQVENGKYFSDHVQGGILLRQESVTPELLKESFLKIFKEREIRKRNISKHKERRNLENFSDVILADIAVDSI